MKPGNYFRHIRIAVKTLIFRCIELAKKYREIIVYVIFGGLTTAVDFGSYTVLSKLFHINDSVSNVISWFAAVIFAYITNKLFVFESKGKGVGKLLYEFGTFFAARAFTGIVYTGGFALMTGVWGVNDYLSKALLSVFNIVVNYIFSKLVTFRRRALPKKHPPESRKNSVCRRSETAVSSSAALPKRKNPMNPMPETENPTPAGNDTIICHAYNFIEGPQGLPRRFIKWQHSIIRQFCPITTA